MYWQPKLCCVVDTIQLYVPEKDLRREAGRLTEPEEKTTQIRDVARLAGGRKEN